MDLDRICFVARQTAGEGLCLRQLGMVCEYRLGIETASTRGLKWRHQGMAVRRAHRTKHDENGYVDSSTVG